MSSLKLSDLLRQFYKHSLPCLPVAGPGGLVGFLILDDVNRLAADIDEIYREFSAIPAELLQPQIKEDLLQSLTAKAQIPVIDEQGKDFATWSKTELYQKMVQLEQDQLASSKSSKDTLAAVVGDDEAGDAVNTGNDWLSQLILASIPHPLLVTDLSGQTMFYNATFVSRILERGPFKNTLALAERYFLEVNRTALARTYSAGPHPVDLLFVSLDELHLTVEITTLEQDRSIVGYLYIFHDPEVMGLPHEIMTRLESGQSLDAILEDVEAGIIASMLRRTGQNVSHAAKALGVNRSTLQNKIRRLDLGQRFHRRVEGPVRRIRSKDDSDASVDMTHEILPAVPVSKQSRKAVLKPSKEAKASKKSKRIAGSKSLPATKTKPTAKKEARKKSKQAD